ncbi:MAG: tetratricopeptide repeat protein [bacterium]
MIIKKISFLLFIINIVLFLGCQKIVKNESGEIQSANSQTELLICFEKIENLWREKQFNKAIIFCQKYIKENVNAKDVDKAQYALGYLYYDYNNINRDYNKAILEFKKVIEFYPKSDLKANAQYWIAMSYHNINQLKKAVEEYEKLEKEYPKSPWTYGGQYGNNDVYMAGLYWAGILNQQEYTDYEKALLYYSKVFQKSQSGRGKDKALSNIRTCFRSIEQEVMKYTPLITYKEIDKMWFDYLEFEESLKICKENLTKDSENKENIIYATAFLKFDYRNPERDLEMSKKDFENFIVQFPQSNLCDDALFWVSMYYYEKNNYKKCIETCQKILNNYPECQFKERIKYRIAKIYEENYKNYQESLKMYNELLKSTKSSSLKKVIEKSIEQIKQYLL